MQFEARQSHPMKTKQEKRTPCILCGAPSVKTHILPRSLLHQLRGDSGHLVVGSAHRDGVEYSQSGTWEYLVCDTHETAFGEADKYGQDFCRRAAQSKDIDTDLIRVDNPRPDILLRFALTCVWRHVNSKSGAEIGLTLGSHEETVRKSVFSGEMPRYQLFLTTSKHSILGEATNIVEFPWRVPFLNVNSWQFTIARITFAVTVSNQRLPQRYAPLDSSKCNPAPIIRMPLVDTPTADFAQPILKRMLRKR